MGSEFGSQVTVANEYTLTGLSSLWGRVTVGAAAVQAMIGGGRLAGRTSVFIQCHPSNADNVYVGFSNAVSASNYAMVMPAGDAKQVTLPSSQDVQIWLFSPTASQFVGVIEGKP